MDDFQADANTPTVRRAAWRRAGRSIDRVAATAATGQMLTDLGSLGLPRHHDDSDRGGER